MCTTVLHTCVPLSLSHTHMHRCSNSHEVAACVADRCGRSSTDRGRYSCSVLRCVAVRCSVLQCVAVRCTVLQLPALLMGADGAARIVAGTVAAVCCSALQCVAVCCSVLQLPALLIGADGAARTGAGTVALCCAMLHCVTTRRILN